MDIHVQESTWNMVTRGLMNIRLVQDNTTYIFLAIIYIYSKLQIYCHTYQRHVTKVSTLILHSQNKNIVLLKSLHT
jgi:hypothetical protein